tara:strand:- start:245 stop:1483 length:1239 start_codon:yes stop_codon:yes gene_type:complete
MPNLQIALSNQLAKNATKTALSLSELIGTMKSNGMSNVAIRQTLLSDLNSGGQLFGSFKNQLKNTVKSGVERSSNDAANSSFTSAGVKQFQWVSVGDKRVCQDCEPRHGETGTLEFFQTVGLPASGFSVCQTNCRCKILPVNYKGENLDEPLIKKRLKKQILDATDFKMAGKHIGKKDSIKWADANSKNGIPYAVDKTKTRFSGTMRVIGSKSPFSFLNKLSVEQGNRLNKLFAESFSLSDSLGIPRLRASKNTGRRGVLAGMGDGTLFINTSQWGKSYSARQLEIWEKQIKRKNFPETTVSYIYNSKNKLEAAERIAFWHEYAHHIHQQKGVKTLKDYFSPPLELKIRKLYDKLKKKSLKDANFRYKNYPSTYAMTNAEEWFAENYTMFKNGYGKRLTKEFKDFLKQEGIE